MNTALSLLLIASTSAIPQQAEDTPVSDEVRTQVLASIALMTDAVECNLSYLGTTVDRGTHLQASLEKAKAVESAENWSFATQSALLGLDGERQPLDETEFKLPPTMRFVIAEADREVLQVCTSSDAYPSIARRGDFEAAYFPRENRLELQSSKGSATLFTGLQMTQPLPRTRSQLSHAFEEPWSCRPLARLDAGHDSEQPLARFLIGSRVDDKAPWLEIDTTGSPHYLPVAARWRKVSGGVSISMTGAYKWATLDGRAVLESAILLTHTEAGCGISVFERSDIGPAQESGDLHLNVPSDARVFDSRKGRRRKSSIAALKEDTLVRHLVRFDGN